MFLEKGRKFTIVFNWIFTAGSNVKDIQTKAKKFVFVGDGIHGITQKINTKLGAVKTSDIIHQERFHPAWVLIHTED